MGGDNGLPQAYASVATGNFGVSEHLERLCLQASLQMFSEKTILKRPATQANPIEPGLPAHQFRNAR